MLRMSENLIHLELGSIIGSYPNRLGREAWTYLSKLFVESVHPLL